MKVKNYLKRCLSVLFAFIMLCLVLPIMQFKVEAVTTVLYPVEWKFQTKGTRFNNLRNTENPENIDYHNGLDISATQGTNIYAVYDGTVEFSGWKDSYGNFVVLYHPALGVYTFYAHASSLVAKQGSSVKQGDVIAKIGSTGNSTGPHLHFGICSKIENGWPRRTYYDPETYFNYTDKPNKWPDSYTVANLGDSFDAIILSSKFRKPIRPDDSSTANVVLYQEEWKNCEMWRFTRQSNGSYKIENFGNGYCLDANRHGTEDGTNISTVASNDYEAQRWFLYAAKDGYIFRPAYCDLAMDILGQKSADNTNIHLWTYHGDDSQIFVVYRNLNGKDVDNYAKPTPPAPTLTVESDSAITVSWLQTMYTEKYVVYRSTDNSNWTKLGETTSLSYKDSGLSASKKYYYKYESVSRFYKETSPSASATTKAPQTVTIKLDGNGGTVSKASFTAAVGSKLDGLNNVTATQTGYTFAGWFTEKEGGTQVKSTDTASKAMTLYAHWTINKLTIHYNANGGTLASDSNYYLNDSNDILNKETKTYEGNTWNYGSGGSAGLYNASTFKLTRTGYTFLGWSLQKSGGTVYDQDDVSIKSQDLSDDLKTKSATVLMYAQWAPKTVKVTFHRNRNTSDTSTATETFTYGTANQKFGYKTDGTGRYSSMNDPSIGFGAWNYPGYTMLGWSTDKAATAKTYTTYSGVAESWINTNSPTVDLYAVWSINSVKVHYNVNGGTITDTSEFYAADNGDIYLTETKAVRETVWTYNYTNKNGLVNASSFKLSKHNYKFLGWSTTKSGGTIIDQDDASVTAKVMFPDIETKSGTVTLYARWEIDVPETLELRNGDQFTLNYPDEAFTFASNNTKVAVVSKNGVITALGKGEAIITLLDADNNAIQIKLKVLPVMIQGDINLDGEVTVADAVLLHKWLLTVPSTTLSDWKAGDMNGDGKLNAVDLTLLKRKLLQG